MKYVLEKNIIVLSIVALFTVFTILVLRLDDIEFILIWCIIYVIVTFLTIHSIIEDIRDIILVRRIISMGECYIGKVVDYRDSNTIINNTYCLDLVVKFTEDNEDKLMVFFTGCRNIREYPIGSIVYIYKHEDNYAATKEKGVAPIKYMV